MGNSTSNQQIYIVDGAKCDYNTYRNACSSIGQNPHVTSFPQKRGVDLCQGDEGPTYFVNTKSKYTSTYGGN